MGVMRSDKQTDAGVIPSDWSVALLGEIALVAAGGTPSRKVNEFWGGEIPWVTTAEIDFNVVSSTTESITTLGLKHSAAKLLQPGTLLMALYGQGKTRGKVAVLGITATTNQACASISVSNAVSRRFVFHYLASQYVAIRGLSNSGSQENLSGQLVRSIKVPLAPSKKEQEAIAEALSDADALIESLEQLLAKKRQIKQSAMQELLTGQRRLPGFSGEWPEKPIGELFSVSGGLSASREQLSTTGHCYLHYGDIHTTAKTHIDLETEYLDIPRLDVQLGKVSPGALLEDGDVVFVDASEDEDGTSRHMVVVNPGRVPFISGLHTIVAKARDDTLDKVYRRYCFQSEGVKKQFRFYAVGTKVSGVSKSNIVKIVLPVPPLSEQSAIATVLSDMDFELAALSSKLAKTRQLKQGMMQELLTGRIRLSHSADGRMQ